MYQIEIVPDALKELKKAPIFYRRAIEAAVEKQLVDAPGRPTKNRKCLLGLVPGFEFEEPLWELRVGTWRVFYDIDEEAIIVVIRAIREKAPGTTTEEIL